jgi:hypothetical protein
VAIGTPWVGPIVQGSIGNNVTTVTVNVSGATNGEVVWIIGTLGDAQTGPVAPPAGWNVLGQTSEGATASASSQTMIFWKVKASGDTTVTINWPVSCRPQFAPISWPGVDTTTPAESLAWLTRASGLSTTYPTGSGTPTAANRWAVGVFSSRGGAASVAWTSDAAQTSRAAVINTTSAYVGLLVADTNAAVTASAHTYTATGQSAAHGIGGVFFLIPAAAAPSVTGTIDGTLPALTGSLTAAAKVSGTESGTLPALTGNLTVNAKATASFTGALGAVAGSVTASMRATSTLTGTLPALTGALSGNVPVARVDITITIGPTRLRELATVGPTRQAVIGLTRSGMGAALTRLRQLLTLGPTRTGTTAGPTRTGTTAGPTRTGTTAGPTRKDRGA